MPVATPSQSAEDYLERIHELIEEKGYARVVDIASTLDVKQASVTSMVQKLGDLGFLPRLGLQSHQQSDSYHHVPSFLKLCTVESAF
jgi:predicted transcriptional regulator